MTDLSLVLRFVFVGGTTSLLFFGLTFVLVEVLYLYPTLASMIASVVAICYNYTLHYHWTFGSGAPHGTVLVRYLAMCVGTFALNATVMQVGLATLPVHYMVVQLLSAVVMLVWNLSISSVWVFRDR